MPEAPPVAIVTSDRLNEKAIIVELSDSSSIILTIEDILAAHPVRHTALQDDEAA